MEEKIENFITQFSFICKYRLLGTGRYKLFLSFVSEKVQQSIDKETKLLNLSLTNKWKDQGGNVHVLIHGRVARRNEKSNIGKQRGQTR